MSGPLRLLERAICYTQESMDAVVAGFGPLPTPCSDWDLHELLAHVNGSLTDLQQGVELGFIDHCPQQDGLDECRDPTSVLVTTFRARSRQLLDTCAGAPQSDGRIAVGGSLIARDVVMVSGAVEIAVHGWDISVACGHHHPIPARLALGLLTLSQLVVDNWMRESLFGAPVPVSPLASPSDQLIAFLGRRPVA
ncbi:maleylpyruvate isomerase family mycothiol-dependent enzyme [Kribbella sp. VKM Ac-2568]|uniref:maleylpyruvate isomerase family mycothiol-dependent enzyme n=1 Tax=Kribbella sp. VKM Ac-2568 TaxID=2512219 RepID=UPI0010E35BF0|nr:maleylpyruvate isomerase family mycothiol-dependent enzyme [Kribbella sp. VKM Ac-2568]TCM37000.1 uncharacterized protein (TIGR03086 family) [Kribbella sp. VKM Ac-2568]